MTMRDQIAAVIAETLGEEHQMDNHVADAILAALPGMIPELFWLGNRTYGSMFDYRIYSTSPHGYFSVFWERDPYGSRVRIAKGLRGEAAAEAAANAHHRAAIAKVAGWTAPPVDSDKGAAE